MSLRSWRSAVGRVVRVHTPERSIEGVLVHASRSVLVLRGASVPQSMGTEATPIEGEVIIDRARIVFGQVP